ncbi:MAG TPA: hypothetical protein VF043_03350 [Ktedonobacteraceae bacterium]
MRSSVWASEALIRRFFSMPNEREPSLTRGVPAKRCQWSDGSGNPERTVVLPMVGSENWPAQAPSSPPTPAWQRAA